MQENERFIKVKVYADSKKNAIMRIGADSFKVWVKQKPREGLANAKMLQLLSSEIGENIKKLKIIKGAKSSGKIIKIL